MVSAKKRFLKDGKFTVPYTTSKGEKKSLAFYNNGFRQKRPSLDKRVDLLPQPKKLYMIKPRELIVRMLKGQCELCEARDSMPKVYQVKKLSELSNEIKWEALMLSKHRKALIVCHDCYEEIHS